MPDEIDVWRVAQLLIKQHGDYADAEARRRHDHCESGGLHDGWAFWWRVVRAIAELRNETAPTRPN